MSFQFHLIGCPLPVFQSTTISSLPLRKFQFHLIGCLGGEVCDLVLAPQVQDISIPFDWMPADGQPDQVAQRTIFQFHLIGCNVRKNSVWRWIKAIEAGFQFHLIGCPFQLVSLGNRRLPARFQFHLIGCRGCQGRIRVSSPIFSISIPFDWMPWQETLSQHRA